MEFTQSLGTEGGEAVSPGFGNGPHWPTKPKAINHSGSSEVRALASPCCHLDLHNGPEALRIRAHASWARASLARRGSIRS